MRYILWQTKWPNYHAFVCYTSLLLTLLFTACIPAGDRAAVEPPPTEVPAYAIPEELAQRLRRQQAQYFAAQAELWLARRQDHTFDLPLLLAREAVLRTWSTDGYVTIAADQALRTVLSKAMADPTLAAISRYFPNPPIFAVAHGAADTWDAAITPDGRILAVATNDDAMGPVNSLRLWEMTSNRFLGKLAGDPADFLANAIRFSPDGNLLLTVSGQKAILWDWRTGEPRITILPPKDAGYITGNFTPDGRAIILAGERVLRLADVVTGEPLRHFGDQTETILSAVFDPTGKLLLTAGQNAPIHLWEVASGRLAATMGRQPFSDAMAAFSPDAKLIAVSAGTVIQLWDVATQKLLYEIAEPGTKSPSFSRDGKYLLVKASVFDLATGAIVRQFTNDFGSPAFQAAFAADGESVVAVVDNDTIEVAPAVDRMLLYADALIQREPPTFTDWELRYFEIGQPVNFGEYQSLDAEMLVPYDRPILSLTPRPRPNSATLSPLPTPTK